MRLPLRNSLEQKLFPNNWIYFQRKSDNNFIFYNFSFFLIKWILKFLQQMFVFWAPIEVIGFYVKDSRRIIHQFHVFRWGTLIFSKFSRWWVNLFVIILFIPMNVSGKWILVSLQAYVKFSIRNTLPFAPKCVKN